MVIPSHEYPNQSQAIPFQAAVEPSAASHYPSSYQHIYQQGYSYELPRSQLTSLHLEQQIRTLFVSGLPDDIKPREIHNLFRGKQGFESCQLKYTGRGDQVVAFASFYSHYAAVAALNELHGRLFDPESGATLHVELAKSNSRPKRHYGTEAYVVIDKRARLNDNQEPGSNDGDGGSDGPFSTDNPSSSNKAAAMQRGDTTGSLDNNRTGSNDQPDILVTTDGPPCSTLFIANLGPSCTEEELKQALSQYTGFRTLKMRARGGMPVAFADFEEVEQAKNAMVSLQGSLLASSDRGGLHLEYARSKMRKH